MSRTLDVLLAGAALILLAPVIAIAALAIRRASPGPAFYRARRAGLHGRPFELIKLRTMHPGAGPRITGSTDPRLFPLGERLRRWKVDELPQLWNVVRGDMALVGPRPEDEEIVHAHYDEAGRATLAVRPGLTSPGTLFYYAAEPLFMDAADIEAVYLEHLLPPKLALDADWMRRRSLMGDLDLLLRTLGVVLLRSLGRSVPWPRECGRLGIRRSDLAAALASDTPAADQAARRATSTPT